MRTEDRLDLMIKSELLKTSQKYKDDGFKKTVMDSLPKRIYPIYIRRLVIYFSGLLASLVFIIIIDKNIILKSITDFYFLIYESIFPSIQSVLFLLIFVFISYIIPKTEFNQGIS